MTDKTTYKGSTSNIDDVEWPKHDASMHIDHNQHLAYYETVQEALDTQTYQSDDFENADAIAECISTGSVWTLQWYPNTPVGFCRVSGPTLSSCIRRALS